MPTVTMIVLVAVSYVTSTISGLLGMGGGIMLLAAMYMAGLEPALAIPLHAFVQLMSNSTRLVLLFKYVRWRPFLWHAVPALPLPYFGLMIVDALDPVTLKVMFGAAVLYATWTPKWGIQHLPENAAFGISGVIAGLLGVVVGATGPLIAPFFLRGGFKKEQVVATKAVCQAYMHTLKIVWFSTVGFSVIDHLDVVIPMAVAVVFGTVTGRALLHRVSERAFFWMYKVVLTLLAIRLLLTPWI